jgi:hypothetical protein
MLEPIFQAHAEVLFADTCNFVSDEVMVCHKHDNLCGRRCGTYRMSSAAYAEPADDDSPRGVHLPLLSCRGNPSCLASVPRIFRLRTSIWVDKWLDNEFWCRGVKVSTEDQYRGRNIHTELPVSGFFYLKSE